MKESYGEGLATHTAPESCGAARKDSVEALTGVRAGRVFSRERTSLRGADAVGGAEGHTRMHRQRKMHTDPARSKTPSTYGDTSHENREILWLPAAMAATGRVGKSKDARRR
jgi:RNA-directed DNA polymerase